MGPGSGGQSTLQGSAFATPLPRKDPDVASLNCPSLERNKKGSLCLAEGRDQKPVNPLAQSYFTC